MKKLIPCTILILAIALFKHYFFPSKKNLDHVKIVNELMDKVDKRLSYPDHQLIKQEQLDLKMIKEITMVSQILAPNKEKKVSETNTIAYSSGRSYLLQELLKRKLKSSTYSDIYQNSNFSHVFLENVNLQHANLNGAYLAESFFEGANLQGANLERANLTLATFKKANLEKANLSKAILKKSDLSYSVLKQAQLDYAYLEEANLTNANLNDSNFENANLNSAIFEYSETFVAAVED